MKNKALQMRLLETSEVEVRIHETEINRLEEHELLINVLACPVNPTDVYQMYARGKLESVSTEKHTSRLSLPYPVSQSTPFTTLGSEGCGLVVDTGGSDRAKSLMGKLVGITGQTFSQYVIKSVDDVVVFPDGTDAQDASAWHINPLTALCIIDHVKSLGEDSFLHTTSMSQLGQMLCRLTNKSPMRMIHIVRRDEQVDALKGMGAEYVVRIENTAAESEQLASCIDALNTRVGFDPIGGDMPAYLLSHMEKVFLQRGRTPYGSGVMKHLFLYGGLDMSPVVLPRTLGLHFSFSTWLYRSYFLQKSKEEQEKIIQFVIENISSTFKTHYGETVGLHDLMQTNTIAKLYALRSGQKLLLKP